MTPRGKPVPIPVVADAGFIGPGSQEADDGLAYMAMPQGMDTYRPPRLPEPEALAGQRGALRVLHAVLDALVDPTPGTGTHPNAGSGGTRVVPLAGLAADERTLVNQVLGEGEVSAQCLASPDDHRSAQVQESVFAGIWRVIETDAQGQVDDRIEVGAVPQCLRETAQRDGLAWQADAAAQARALAAPPEGVLNATHVLAELAQHRAAWQPGQPNAVVNLTLLPMSPADIAWMDHVLGTGRVLLLSRGYGNCRITSAGAPHTWRVVYYNSQDQVILNTVEVGELPTVAQAAAEDLADSRERLAEVLQWVAQA